ncbi:MAG: hypothetical protein IMZ71_01155 [Chloroflexi bacterium]|nr:hypothetical protein [Chloroflexota bacterium]
MTTIRDIAEGIVSLPTIDEQAVERELEARLAADDEDEATPEHRRELARFDAEGRGR